MKIWQYRDFFRGLFYEHLKKIVKSSEIPKPISEKAIKFEIIFNNKSVLKVVEYWSLDNKELSEKESYSYQYITSDGFFFRYDKESDIKGSTKKSMVEQLKKPDCHIHIGVLKQKFDQNKHSTFLKEDEGPHFKTHSADVIDVLGTIVTNFFKDECGNFEEFLEKNKKLSHQYV